MNSLERLPNTYKLGMPQGLLAIPNLLIPINEDQFIRLLA